MSLIPARCHAFVEINPEIFSTGNLLFPLIQEGLLRVTSVNMCKRSLVLNRLVYVCPGKSVVRLTDRLDMTIHVDWDVKPQIKTSGP